MTFEEYKRRYGYWYKLSERQQELAVARALNRPLTPAELGRVLIKAPAEPLWGCPLYPQERTCIGVGIDVR
jgi:hypothetical protein